MLRGLLQRPALGARRSLGRTSLALQIRWLHPLFDLQKKLHRESIENPVGFWSAAARDIDWQSPPSSVYDKAQDLWFPGAKLNVCHNALDRHVARGLGQQVALIHDSAAAGIITKYTYERLLKSVQVLAGILRQYGLNEKSKILIYMPAIPQATMAMLACARIGAPHVVVFGGFAPKELSVRLSDSKADAIITATYGLEPGRQIDYISIINQAIELAISKPRRTLVFDRDLGFAKGKAILEPAKSLKHSRWQEEELEYLSRHGLSYESDKNWDQHPGARCTWIPSEHPLYILHTSGSTGLPKGIVRQSGGYAVGLSWSTKNIFGIDAKDTFWAASDVGWVLGHSYLTYGPLIRGATTILFEGKPVGQPDSSVFFRILAQHNVKTFFCAPTALRAIKREDPDGLLVTQHGLAQKLQVAFLAGERCDPDSLIWCKQMLKKLSNGRHIEVLDNWWSTETGWPNCATAFGLKELLPAKDQQSPIFPDDKIGSCGIPVPGSNMAVVVPDSKGTGHEEGAPNSHWKEAQPDEMGNIAMRLPLPPGAFRSLSNDPDGTKIHQTYYSRIPGLFDSADAGFVDKDGFFSVMGRIDDVINVAGHRLSTGTMESVLSTHPAVAECCVIGIQDQLKGHVPLAFVVLKHHALGDSEADIIKELKSSVREQIGAFAALKDVLFVPRVPKTRSGKILRKCLRQLLDGETVAVPPTVEDPAALDDIRQVCTEAGLLPS